MVRLPGGTFLMDSSRHYPEEAPAHRVTVSRFWIDETPVTNLQFLAFVTDTGHVTIAETGPDPGDYPGASAEDMAPASVVFTLPDHPVDLGNHLNWWSYVLGADWRHPYGTDSSIAGPRAASRRARELHRRQPRRVMKGPCPRILDTGCV